MQEDNAEKFSRLNALFQSNVISRSEFRAELDLEDIDGGSAVYYQTLLNQSTTATVEPLEPIVEPIVAIASQPVKRKRAKVVKK
jgi:hypothetical protein